MGAAQQAQAASAADVRTLRDKTGAGMMDCKRALEETGGDLERAIEYLRKKGAASAEKKATRTANQGVVTSYIHGGGRIGVLVEINCETDFVARNENFQTFTRDIAMHIAAANPRFIDRERVPQEVVAKEREIYSDQARQAGKPEQVIVKMVEGKVEKFFEETCLLDQNFIKNPDQKIRDYLKEMIAKIGENIVISRFVRYELGRSDA